MGYSTDIIKWKEAKNGITIECSLQLAIHKGTSDTVFLIVPGVDGSLDGYDNKYVKIAEDINTLHDVTVIRMSNPFISSFHWESNLRQVLAYIDEHSRELFDNKPDIRIMAHSAGASVATWMAWEYPEITQLLLVNPASKLNLERMKDGLARTQASNITVVYGSEDPSVGDSSYLVGSRPGVVQLITLKGVDHYFSGDSLEEFLSLPSRYLFR